MALSGATPINSYISYAVAPFSSYVSNPMTSALDCGAHDILNAANVACSTCVTEAVELPAGSAQTAVIFNDPLNADLERSGIAQVTPASSQVTVPFAGVSDASVILATYHLDSGASVDATATAVDAVETGAGSFIIKMNAAATAAVKVAYFIAKL